MSLENKIVGAAERAAPTFHYGQSVEVADEPLLMQFAAVLIELPMVLPSVTAAMAMAPPTIARINAYSAAEAPESSLSRDTKFFIQASVLSSFDEISTDHVQSAATADDPLLMQF